MSDMYLLQSILVSLFLQYYVVKYKQPNVLVVMHHLLQVLYIIFLMFLQVCGHIFLVLQIYIQAKSKLNGLFNDFIW
jgi:hypothetical protein